MSLHGLDTRPYPALAPLCRPDTRDTLLARLREVAHATPSATAVVADDGAVTFDEFLHRVYAVARTIAAITPDETRPVAVETACTTGAITLMLAVMASGRALVPLDPNLPEGRQENIVGQAGARRIDVADIERAQESSEPLPRVTGSRIALIAFTSGSTGTAKGVLLSHRMCLTKAYEVSSSLGLSPSSRVGNALPISFGAGINTVFAGILSGATVYCRDPRNSHSDNVIEWISQHELTTLHCSPSLVRSMAPNSRSSPVHVVPDNAVPSLKHVVTYGEPLHARDVLAIRSASGSGAIIVNWYATTEAGAVARQEYRASDALPAGFLAAGTPPLGKTLDIVLPDGQLARSGEVGQIRVTADCFADGYLHLTEQTDARFTTDSGLRRYWTGDLGRIDDHGVLHLVGRVDDAVKIRGYQVEPAEVEGALRSIPGITDAFVTSRSDDSGTELVAYFAGTKDAEAGVRRALREALPEWMIPQHISALAAIPRTDRGKVDRAALPDAVRLPEEASESVRVGATENWLANIVARELGRTALHRDADFSELGATSLAITRILVEIQQAFHVQLSPADVVDAMTVHALAAVIDERHASVDRAKSGSKNSILVPLRTEGSKAPLFVVAGAGVPAVGLATLAKRLEDRPVYALQARGLDTRALPHRTLRGAARAFVREIQRVQPHGPYNLAGHSLGAWIALAMAEILRSRVEVVERVVLLDPLLYRWLLDKLPGGERLEAAPPDVGNPLYKRNARVVLRQAWRVAAAGLVRFTTTERWLAFAIIGSIALQRHKPTPYDGQTTVIVSDNNTHDLASWQAIAPGSEDITAVPGPHLGLVREPVVATVAQVIDRALDTHSRDTHTRASDKQALDKQL